MHLDVSDRLGSILAPIALIIAIAVGFKQMRYQIVHVFNSERFGHRVINGPIGETEAAQHLPMRRLDMLYELLDIIAGPEALLRGVEAL